MTDPKKRIQKMARFFIKNKGYKRFLRTIQASKNNSGLTKTKWTKSGNNLSRKTPGRKIIQTVIILILLSPQPARACFDQASETYNIPISLLKAIAIVESGNNPLAVNMSNKNNTRDIGLMQINSQWLKKLKKYGISEKNLFEPCQNILVSAWILRQKLNKHGYNWQGIGAYNSSKPKPNLKYAWKIFKVLEGLK